MESWREALSEDTLRWLLEEDNPSVRYLTLVNLLDRPETDGEAQSAKKDIMQRGAVPDMLKIMRSDDYASILPRFYTAKYKGLAWQLIILAELCADGSNEQIRGCCEYLLERSQERESGAFSIETSAKLGGGRKSEIIPCLTGNMVWALCRLGMGEDARVKKAAQWLAVNQRYDDGDGAPSGRPECWGGHSCFMGVVKALKGFSEIPPQNRTDEINGSVKRGAEFMLRHHIFRQSHDLNKVSKPGWKKFSFPLMYRTDVLEILLILGKLGARDERMREAAELVISKRDAQGRWAQESEYLGKFLFDLEQNGQSKWITLRALEALKMYYTERP